MDGTASTVVLMLSNATVVKLMSKATYPTTVVENLIVSR